MDADKRVEAMWCVDSETGEHILLDLQTGQELARKDRNGNIIYGRPE
jgi:hypothetical protein